MFRQVCHPKLSFSFEQEKKWKVVISWYRSMSRGKFVTTVYRKPTFSGAYSHFGSFLTTIYEFGMIYFLAYNPLKICSDWTKFHEELSVLK